MGHLRCVYPLFNISDGQGGPAALTMLWPVHLSLNPYAYTVFPTQRWALSVGLLTSCFLFHHMTGSFTNPWFNAVADERTSKTRIYGNWVVNEWWHIFSICFSWKSREAEFKIRWKWYAEKLIIWEGKQEAVKFYLTRRNTEGDGVEALQATWRQTGLTDRTWCNVRNHIGSEICWLDSNKRADMESVSRS